MADTSKPAFTAGIILGVLYLVCAVFAVPAEAVVLLAAPFLCGILAVYMSGKSSPPAVGMGGGVKLGAVTGVIGGLVLVVIGAPLLYFILSAVAGDEIREQLRQSGINLPFSGFLLLVIATAIEAVIGVVLAAIGGLIAAPIFGKR